MPRSNMFKIAVATAAAAVGAILAITSVFAHSSAPTTGGTSILGNIVNAANSSTIPDDSQIAVSNELAAEQAQDAAEAAALAAKIAAEQQAEAAELAAKQAAEAAEAAETDEDSAETETADVDTDKEAPKTVKTEHSDSGGGD